MDALQGVGANIPRLAFVAEMVQHDRFLHLPGDGRVWKKSCHGILRDEANRSSAERASLRPRAGEEVFAIKQQSTAFDNEPLIQPEDAPDERRFAAT